MNAPPPRPAWSPPGPAPFEIRPRPSSSASPLGQLATYGVLALALVLVLAPAGESALGVVACLALGGGIAVGLGAGLAHWFEGLPGFLAAVIAVGTIVVGSAIGVAVGLPFPPWQVLPLAFLFVLGLDWTRVERLRLYVFVGGVLVVPVVGLERGWALPAALVWLVAALGCLWVLEHDRRNALDAPVPLGPPGPGPGSHPADLARTLGIALLVGLAAAFLLGNPSCSFRPPSPNTPDLPDTGFDPGNPTGQGGDPSGGRSFQEYELEGRRQERGYELGEGGERSFVDPETGQRDTVEPQPDGTSIIRDGSGEPVGRLDDEGVVATDGDQEQRYQVDDDGRLTVPSADGEETYHLGEEDGSPVLRNDDDEVVARSDGDDHLVVEDPEGNVLVDDPDGDGRIPVPDGAVRHGVGAEGDPEGRTYETDGDRTIVTDPDGSTRVHDTDPEGHERIRIEEPGRAPRTYTYEPDGRGTWVNEYDDDGTLLDRYYYDPDAEVVEGQIGDDTSDGSGSTTDQEADDGGGSDGTRVWFLLGAVALAVAAAAWWYVRHKRAEDGPETERTWAEELQARVEELGRERGRARGASETVVEYTAALSGGVLPHERLDDVGRVLSDALFGPVQPPEATKAWARSTVEEAAEANPVSGRRKPKEPVAAG